MLKLHANSLIELDACSERSYAMTNGDELRQCCQAKSLTRDARRVTIGCLWKQSCGLPAQAALGATCRKNSARVHLTGHPKTSIAAL